MARVSDPEDNFRRPPSYMKDSHLSEYEQEKVGSGNIQPAGWVINSQGNVRVEDDGLHVTDGAVFIEDSFGQNVLSGAGFGATWVDFIDAHVYNHSFRAGTTDAITAATEVGSADTTDEYAASISDDLPYWVILSRSGTGTVQRVADADAPSGFAFQWRGECLGAFYQDIPISPGQKYAMYVTWKHVTPSGHDFSVAWGFQYRDKDHAAIGSKSESSLTYGSPDAATYTSQLAYVTPTESPANARFLRVFIAVDVPNSAFDPDISFASVNVDPIYTYGTQRIVGGSTQYDLGRGVKFLDGSGSEFVSIHSSTTGDGVSLTDDAGTGGAFLEMNEMSAPSAPVVNRGRLFLRDNGAGKTQLCIQFSTGAVQVIATQP